MRIAISLLVLTALPFPATAVLAHGGAAAHVAAAVEVSFSVDEIRIIRAYYRAGDDARGGRSKHKGLPPGIAKNLARGKRLPPGIAKRYLPGDLQRALPPARDGYERIVLDGKILLVDIATQVVHDILSDIVLN